MTGRTGQLGQDNWDRIVVKETRQSEHDSMDRTAWIGKLGDKHAETGSRESTGGTGLLDDSWDKATGWQDNHGRKDRTG